MSAFYSALFAAGGAATEGASARGMSPTDVALFATVIGSMLLFGGAAVLALSWAFRAGQFDNFQQGSRSIFGPDEPIGEGTDAFPGARPAEADREPEPFSVTGPPARR
ncbi:hypothetical protein GobsT_06010 [Gemmata obscuriglobus]|uniref:Cbb3-type cytochrome oxidase assembly protein CcoS n=1 Tax=Gemmata obscuriglobus TaxID=114 RepID=A0A2Z3HD09_9BACT|nr:cbb3-type cytochrome oxidase assembly protein CcoS [Gemmata obscuriglobus]AWM40845.1 cbb3-type cytochrome oxidase assembly protein CcoS [Gemmata obscuriglobus]QEG25866.1 hypothetical protein GobsT_06010 [Gemmata obscuriglobus]VTR99876.1 Uncharacterized protein OS=Isosphaera pallida (strain ATCC 43644 / DSM 9630 / IS1B) GN=Isop_0395 PE=4 SV=1: CcoS [Gemmata obscuriglobus UQM 2246]